MRILFIHEVNYVTKPVFEMHEFPEGLSRLGHEVGFLNFAEGPAGHESARLNPKETVEGRAYPQASITLYTPRFVNGKMLGRLEAAIRARKTIQETVNDFHPQVIVCYAVPTFGWQAVRVAKKNNIPLVFRALDASHLIRKGPWEALVLLAEKYIARESYAISANNLAMREYQIELGAKPSKVSVHYPYLDIKMYRQGSRRRVRDLLDLKEDSKVIMYLGSFFYFSGLHQVLSSFSEIHQDGDYKIVLVGGGEQEVFLRKKVKELGIQDRVIFAGFVTFNEVTDYLAAADVLINPMIKNQVSDVALPNKVIQYLAARVPLVSTKLRGLEATFSDFPAVVWTAGPRECLEEAITLIADSPRRTSSQSLERLEHVFGEPALRQFESYLDEVATSV